MKRFYDGMVLAILGGLALGLGMVIFDQRLSTFLHPKMHGFVIGLFVVALGLFVYQLIALINNKGTMRKFKLSHVTYLVILIPVILILMNPSVLSQEVLNNRARDFLSTDATNKDTTDNAVLEANSEMDTATSSDLSDYNLSGVDHDWLEVDAIEGDQFMTTLERFYGPEDPVGETMTLEGFVYLDPYNPDFVVVSRLMMSCCAADAMLFGMYTDVAPTLVEAGEDQWIRVTGIVGQIEVFEPFVNDYVTVFYLKDAQFETIEAYAHPYVFQ